MHLRLALFTLLCLMAVVVAPAQVLFDNGPISGTVDAWTINFGYVVSDTFTLVNPSTVKGFDFAVWEYPGDKVLSVDWSITEFEFGGTTYGQGTADVVDTFVSNNQYGYAIDSLTVSGLNVAMPFGTYWFNLQNAISQQGNPVYWDENDGVGCHSVGCPSEASNNAVGTLGSESFDITGTTGTIPEPSSLLLFGWGVLGVVGLLRRKR